jgi:hypothetical protein
LISIIFIYIIYIYINYSSYSRIFYDFRVLCFEWGVLRFDPCLGVFSESSGEHSTSNINDKHPGQAAQSSHIIWHVEILLKSRGVRSDQQLLLLQIDAFAGAFLKRIVGAQNPPKNPLKIINKSQNAKLFMINSYLLYQFISPRNFVNRTSVMLVPSVKIGMPQTKGPTGKGELIHF